MSHPEATVSAADRNLLFGTLALQMDFISRDALIDALNAWAQTKDRSLGEILLEHKAFRPDEHDFLEVLVEKHLERHGNDPRQSLTAVRVAGTVRKELEQIDDPELQATLVRVDGAGTAEAEPHRPPAPAVGAPTSSGRRFRVLRPHARGGLGAVFLAVDEELHREVALKEIQEQHAHHPDSRTRFLLEAEITGALEHPGIVPVYGLGQYSDGRPYYAMRFIRGDSLSAAIARFHQADKPGRDPGERALALRELLSRFIAACNAVAYAHSRGVIHRDLKPANIMLGPYGETLVVDWGLAKPLGKPESPASGEEPTSLFASASGSAATQMGSALGTPQFMSPEQAAGQLDRLGPASDIYSLGATLYGVLTGGVAFPDGDVMVVLAKVQRGEFAPPGQVKKVVPRALEAICLKAMALKPQDRYGTPRALADDLEHWLADEPVSAYREPWTARARRWLGRHRTLVTAAASAVLVAVIGLAVATVLLTAAKESVTAAYHRETKARKSETEARKLAQQRERQARDAEKSASEQRAQTLDTLKTVVLDIEQKMADQDGPLEPSEVRKLRRQLLKKAIAELQRLARSAEQSAEAKRSLMESHLTLGAMLLRSGKTNRARENYQSAQELAVALVQADPNDLRAQRAQGLAHVGLGDVRLLLEQPEAAQAAYTRALKLGQRALDLRRKLLRKNLAPKHPDDMKIRRDLFIAYCKVGNVRLQLGQTRDAGASFRKALQTAAKLAEAERSFAQEKLGDVNLDLGETRAARDHYREALAQARKALTNAGSRNAARRRLMICHGKMGDLLLALGENASALDAYQQARVLADELARIDPRSAEAQRDRMIAANHLGDVHLKRAATADEAEAELTVAGDFYRQGREVAERLAQADPRSAVAQRDLARAQERLGDVSGLEGDANSAAQDAYRKAVAITETLARDGSLSARDQRDLARQAEKLGDASLRLGDTAEARRAYDRARELRKELVQRDPDNPLVHAELAMTYSRQGGLEQQGWKFEAALLLYRRALAALQQPERRARLQKLARYAGWVKRLKERVADCQAAQQAIASLQFAAGQPADRAMPLLWIRIVVLAERGQVEEAAQATARLRTLAPEDPGNLYSVACGYAHCVAAVDRGKDSNRLPDSAEELGEQYANRAIEALRAAIRKGFTDVDLLKEDSILAPLHSRADFRRLLAVLERTARAGDREADRAEPWGR